jgi:uncharacterized membrane protein (Fun14 family)
MNVHDWALVTFTLLSQMSIGAFVVLGIIHTYAIRKAGMQEADRLSDRGLLAIIPVMVLGLAASLTHLGSPLVAYNAVNNLATSWFCIRHLTMAQDFLFHRSQYHRLDCCIDRPGNGLHDVAHIYAAHCTRMG